MVIEWLQFDVSPELRERFVQKDDEIWTPALSKYPGFLGKEIWISPDRLTEIVLVIRWEPLEQWQSIPAQELEQIEAQFQQAMGDTYRLTQSSKYQVRKHQG